MGLPFDWHQQPRRPARQASLQRAQQPPMRSAAGVAALLRRPSLQLASLARRHGFMPVRRADPEETGVFQLRIRVLRWGKETLKPYTPVPPPAAFCCCVAWLRRPSLQLASLARRHGFMPVRISLRSCSIRLPWQLSCQGYTSCALPCWGHQAPCSLLKALIEFDAGWCRRVRAIWTGSWVCRKTTICTAVARPHKILGDPCGGPLCPERVMQCRSQAVCAQGVGQNAV